MSFVKSINDIYEGIINDNTNTTLNVQISPTFRNYFFEIGIKITSAINNYHDNMFLSCNTKIKIKLVVVFFHCIDCAEIENIQTP